MKLVLKNSNLIFKTKKVLVENSNLYSASMNDLNKPGKVVTAQATMIIYKNVSGGALSFNLSGSANTWSTPGYLYGVFDNEPEIGSVASSYQSVTKSQVFNFDVIVPNGKYIGISEYAYAPASGGSCTVTYEEV